VLAVTKKKLQAADNEIRYKIFALLRKTNTHLQTSNLDLPLLRQITQELQVHIDSYRQLTDQSNHVTITAEFYHKKLEIIRELARNSRTTFDRRFNECLTGLDSKGGKNDLSTMLCEVQADVAKQELSKELDASIRALRLVSEQQVKAGRRANSSTISASELEIKFKERVEIIKLAQTT